MIPSIVKDSPIQTDDRITLEATAPLSLYKETVADNLNQLRGHQVDIENHLVQPDILDRETIVRTRQAMEDIFTAKIYSLEDHLEDAASEFEKSASVISMQQLRKELAYIYFDLGRRAYEKNDMALTTSYMEKSIQIYPRGQTYLNLTLLYLTEGRVAKATQMFEKAKALEPRIGEIETALQKQKGE